MTEPTEGQLFRGVVLGPARPRQGAAGQKKDRSLTEVLQVVLQGRPTAICP
jgi:hypothetical protein